MERGRGKRPLRKKLLLQQNVTLSPSKIQYKLIPSPLVHISEGGFSPPSLPSDGLPQGFLAGYPHLDPSSLVTTGTTSHFDWFPDSEWLLARFQRKTGQCGFRSLVLICSDCSREYAVPHPCSDRFCSKCARKISQRAGSRISSVLECRGLKGAGTVGFIASSRLRFITLTVENFEKRQVRWGLDVLNAAFARLSRRKFWRDKCRGWVKKTEVTVAEDGRFHLHLHLLVEGDYLDQGALRSAWKSCVRSQHWRGFVVDIRRFKGGLRGLNEITKYTAKLDDVDNDEDKAFLSWAFKGRRLYSFGGFWSGLVPPPEPKHIACECGAKNWILDGSKITDSLGHNWVPFQGDILINTSTRGSP